MRHADVGRPWLRGVRSRNDGHELRVTQQMLARD